MANPENEHEELTLDDLKSTDNELFGREDKSDSEEKPDEEEEKKESKEKPEDEKVDTGQEEKVEEGVEEEPSKDEQLAELKIKLAEKEAERRILQSERDLARSKKEEAKPETHPTDKIPLEQLSPQHFIQGEEPFDMLEVQTPGTPSHKAWLDYNRVVADRTNAERKEREKAQETESYLKENWQSFVEKVAKGDQTKIDKLLNFAKKLDNMDKENFVGYDVVYQLADYYDKLQSGELEKSKKVADYKKKLAGKPASPFGSASKGEEEYEKEKETKEKEDDEDDAILGKVSSPFLEGAKFQK